MLRPDVDATWIAVAQVVALRGTCPRLQVGAVVVSADGIVVATGYNGAPRSLLHCAEVGCLIEPETGRCKRTVHGEANALLQAGTRAKGSTLYVTHEPCSECTNLILNAGIARVVFLAPYLSQNSELALAKQAFYREAGVRLEQLEEYRAIHLL